METKVRVRWTSAGAVVAVAIAASLIALVASNEPPVRAEYVPLGPKLAPIAQALELPAKDVARVKYGREFVSGFAPVPHSATDSLHVAVERFISRTGRETTTLNIEANRSTGSDAILLPWSLVKVLRPDEFVVSLDLERVELRTSVCDERSGETKALSFTWHTKVRDSIDYGILAQRGGDASVTGRFGDQELMGRTGGAYIQLWGGADRSNERPDGHVRLNGRRMKPVRCPVQ
jgi:hypothetical protein